jgi:hypothetical protein
MTKEKLQRLVRLHGLLDGMILKNGLQDYEIILDTNSNNLKGDERKIYVTQGKFGFWLLFPSVRMKIDFPYLNLINERRAITKIHTREEAMKLTRLANSLQLCVTPLHTEADMSNVYAKVEHGHLLWSGWNNREEEKGLYIFVTQMYRQSPDIAKYVKRLNAPEWINKPAPDIFQAPTENGERSIVYPQSTIRI